MNENPNTSRDTQLNGDSTILKKQPTRKQADKSEYLTTTKEEEGDIKYFYLDIHDVFNDLLWLNEVEKMGSIDFIKKIEEEKKWERKLFLITLIIAILLLIIASALSGVLDKTEFGGLLGGSIFPIIYSTYNTLKHGWIVDFEDNKNKKLPQRISDIEERYGSISKNDIEIKFAKLKAQKIALDNPILPTATDEIIKYREEFILQLNTAFDGFTKEGMKTNIHDDIKHYTLKLFYSFIARTIRFRSGIDIKDQCLKNGTIPQTDDFQLKEIVPDMEELKKIKIAKAKARLIVYATYITLAVCFIVMLIAIIGNIANKTGIIAAACSVAYGSGFASMYFNSENMTAVDDFRGRYVRKITDQTYYNIHELKKNQIDNMLSIGKGGSGRSLEYINLVQMGSETVFGPGGYKPLQFNDQVLTTDKENTNKDKEQNTNSNTTNKDIADKEQSKQNKPHQGKTSPSQIMPLVLNKIDPNTTKANTDTLNTLEHEVKVAEGRLEMDKKLSTKTKNVQQKEPNTLGQEVEKSEGRLKTNYALLTEPTGNKQKTAKKPQKNNLSNVFF